MSPLSWLGRLTLRSSRPKALRYTNMMKTIIFISIILLANVCASATLEEVYSHEYGVWSIESNDKLSKRVIIHNIITAKDDNIFHIEVVGTEDPQQPWRVTRLKSHLAIKPEVLAPSLISPLSKGKVYPEHFNFEFEAWQKQQIKIICTTELFKCIK